MKDLISHLFPPNLFQLQNRYLRRGLFKPCDTDIRDSICRIDKMVEYLEKYPPFGAEQRLKDSKIPNLVEFSLPK